MKYLLCLTFSLVFILPVFAQNSKVNTDNPGINSNESQLITLSPRYKVENNKVEIETLSKNKIVKKQPYDKEKEAKKIQSYIKKIELHIKQTRLQTNSNLEVKELQYLLTKLKTKLASLND